jgi:RND family efflux transporter MFP subunit
MKSNGLLKKAVLSVGVAVLGVCVAAPLVGAQAGQDRQSSGLALPGQLAPGAYLGQALPIEERQFSLRVPHVVMKVNVKEGQRVKKGDTLLIEDDREEQKRLALLQKEASSDIAVRAMKKTADNRKVELERVTSMYNKQIRDGERAATKFELDKAQLEHDLALLETEKAQFDLDTKGLQANLQEQVLNQMRIVSTIDGVVQQVMIKEGEVVDPQRPVIRVVNNDVLKVEVYLPVLATIELEKKVREQGENGPGVELDVLLPGKKEPVKGKLTFFDPESDPGASMRRVWLEVQNKEGLPSGLSVQVVLPQELRVADALIK